MTRQNGSREGNDGVAAEDILLCYDDIFLSRSRVPFAGELYRVSLAEGRLILTVGGRYRRNDKLFLYRLGSEVELVARLRSRDRYRTDRNRNERRALYASDRLIGRRIDNRQLRRSGSRHLKTHAIVEELREEILPSDGLGDLTGFYMHRYFGRSRGIDSRVSRREDDRIGLLTRLRNDLRLLPCERTFYGSLSA